MVLRSGGTCSPPPGGGFTCTHELALRHSRRLHPRVPDCLVKHHGGGGGQRALCDAGRLAEPTVCRQPPSHPWPASPRAGGRDGAHGFAQCPLP